MVPVGYLIGSVFMAVWVLLGLRPRSTNGPRATPSFVLATVASELPVVMLLRVVAPTVLAGAEGDLDSVADTRSSAPSGSSRGCAAKAAPLVPTRRS